MSTTFSPFSSAAAAAPRLWLMRLTFASLLVLPPSASLILLLDCLKVSAGIPIVVEVVTVVALYVTEVPPRRLHGDAVPHDTS